MKTELLIAKEAAILFKRNPDKYKRGVAGMYLLSLYGLKQASIFRSGYYFTRHIDDVLDGDRQVSSDPLGYVLDLKHQVETGRYKDSNGIIILAKESIDRLEQNKKPGDSPRLDLLKTIDWMIFDHQRSKTRESLPQAKLDEYFFAAFDPANNLALMALAPTLRSRNIPAMAYSQGRVYSARDLKTDWIKGIINIPADILLKANLTTDSSLQQVLDSHEVTEWFKQMLAVTKPELLVLQKQFKTTQGAATNFIFGGLISPMLRFIDRYTKQ